MSPDTTCAQTAGGKENSNRGGNRVVVAVTGPARRRKVVGSGNAQALSQPPGKRQQTVRASNATPASR